MQDNYPPKTKIAELTKNKFQKIVFSLSVFRDEEYVDVRIYTLPVVTQKKPDPVYVPTAKGIMFRRDLLPDFIAALQLVKNELPQNRSLMQHKPLTFYELSEKVKI